MKKLFIFLFLCIGLLGTTSSAQTFSPKELEAKIDAMIPGAVEDDTPGLVVGIVQNGELIFSKGYGLANLSYNMKNDPNMVYNIGSVAKQFLGYAFAMLHVKGALNIDDPVTKYLEDWPEFEHKVALRHLLTHTSGYREAYTMSQLAGRQIGVDRLSREECLNVVRRQPSLEFVPGSRYTYNSTAWVILAEVLEKVTETPADEWVMTNIIQPLGMNDTQIESKVGDVIVNPAESYSGNKKSGFINQKSNRAIFGAADIYTNIPDMAKWVNHYRTSSIGGSEVQELFLDPFTLNDGSDSGYALGIGNATYKGIKRYRHTGGHEAFSTQVSYFPEHDLGIITISNYGGNGWLATSKIADLLLADQLKEADSKKLTPIEVSTADLEKLAGLYVFSSNNRTLEVKMENGGLTAFNGDKLVPTAPNTFGIDDWDGQLKFDTSTTTTKLVLKNRTTQNFYKAAPWNPTAEDLQEYSGDYWSNEVETVYHFSVKNDKLTINHRWMNEISFEVIAKDLFKAGPMYVKFHRNDAGKITSLGVNSGRTLNVVFQKKS